MLYDEYDADPDFEKSKRVARALGTDRQRAIMWLRLILAEERGTRRQTADAGVRPVGGRRGRHSLAALDAARDEGIAPDEVARAKRQLRARMVFELWSRAAGRACATTRSESRRAETRTCWPLPNGRSYARRRWLRRDLRRRHAHQERDDRANYSSRSVPRLPGPAWSPSVVSDHHRWTIRRRACAWTEGKAHSAVGAGTSRAPGCCS